MLTVKLSDEDIHKLKKMEELLRKNIEENIENLEKDTVDAMRVRVANGVFEFIADARHEVESVNKEDDDYVKKYAEELLRITKEALVGIDNKLKGKAVGHTVMKTR